MWFRSWFNSSRKNHFTDYRLSWTTFIICCAWIVILLFDDLCCACVSCSWTRTFQKYCQRNRENKQYTSTTHFHCNQTYFKGVDSIYRLRIALRDVLRQHLVRAPSDLSVLRHFNKIVRKTARRSIHYCFHKRFVQFIWKIVFFYIVRQNWKKDVLPHHVDHTDNNHCDVPLLRGA